MRTDLLRKRGVWAILYLASPLGDTAFSQRADPIGVGDSWKYARGLEEPPASWTARTFDDSGWADGRTGIGYGDGDDITVLGDMKGSYLTVYARRAFVVEDPAAVRRLILRLGYDDGFVAYLNGTEVARRGLGSPGTPVDRNTRATSHDAEVMEVFDVSPGIPSLVAGTNVLAVEVHNDSLSSGDLSFAPALRIYGPEVAIVRGPYLQLLGERSVLLRWETDPPGSGAVEYGPGPEPTLRLDAGTGAAHEAVLAGLPPGTECCYRILAAGSIVSPTFRFRTAPPRSASRFRMAVFGDTEKLTEGLLGMPRIVEAMQPEIALVLGDTIRGGDADTYVYDPWRKVLPSCAFYPVLGNHDLDDRAAAYLATYRIPSEGSGSERYYSFDRGDVHIACLDVTDDDAFGVGSTQWRWLRSDLAAADRLWKVVTLHESPYSTGATHGSDLAVRQTLCPIFDEFAVDLVFSGHNHNFERTYPIRAGKVVDASATSSYVDPEGTIYVVSGGAGGSLYARDADADKSFSAFFRASHHACRVEVDGGVLRLEAVDLAGAVFHAFEIRKSGASPLRIDGLEVREVRAQSARVVWTTPRPASATVEFGREGAFDRVLTDGSPVTAHDVLLDGLEGGTRYQVRVRSEDGAGNEASGGPISFATLRFFLRGDANGDGAIDVSDAVRILIGLFVAGDTVDCPDAFDVDDSGALDSTDALALLGYLFRGGLPPPGPFPAAGDDPSPTDPLECR